MSCKTKQKVISVVQNPDTEIKLDRLNNLLDCGWIIKEQIYVCNPNTKYLPEIVFILEKNENF